MTSMPLLAPEQAVARPSQLRQSRRWMIGVSRKRHVSPRASQRRASALVLAASRDDIGFFSDPFGSDSVIRDMRALERRMDELFSEPSTSAQPSWRRDRESSQTFDQGCVTWALSLAGTPMNQ